MEAGASPPERAPGDKGQFGAMVTSGTNTTLGITPLRDYVAGMTAIERSQQRMRIDAWRNAEREMAALRQEDIRNSTADGIRAVIPSADLMRRLGVEPSAETGLIEQQAWFAKMRHA